MIDLSKNGILLNLNGKPIRVFFLVFITADNLGANDIFGFAKSFNATQYCRICRIDKNLAHKLTKEDPNLLRNKENYQNDCENNSNGVKETCIFHRIPNFHVLDNTAVDPMHDLFEGVCRYDMAEILYDLIYVKKFFSLQIFNSRVTTFDKSLLNDKNLLPVLSAESIISKNLTISASEMAFLIQLIGDLVPKTSKAWTLYLLLREIVNIVVAPSVNDGIIERLTIIISEHQSLYMKLSNASLKPKFHFITHYPHLMRKFGPLMQFSCFRFEGKYKGFKDTASSMTSRQNPSYSLSLKHQLEMSYRFFLNRGFTKCIEAGPEISNLHKMFDYSNFNHVLPKDWNGDNYVSVNWVRVNGTYFL